MKQETRNNKLFSGQILIIGIIFMAVILIISASLFSRVANFLHFNSGGIMSEQATVVAEGGVDYALWKLNTMAGSCGSGDTAWCNIETTLGTTGSFEITVTDKTSTLKTLTVTGYIPNKTSPRAKRTIKLDASINTNEITFQFAVQIGAGGLIMENSSRINGTVYTNGNINGSGSSRITGDAWAVGTISSPDPTVDGTKHPGASPVPLPSIGPPCDVDCWKTASNVDNDPLTCPCTYSSNDTLGPKRLNGNLTVQGSAVLTINGPVYVTGNVVIQNSAKIKLNNSFGSQGTVIIVDGTVKTENSGSFEPTNADPKGYILVVSGSTNSNAIELQNSGANAIFYALSGGAELSNSAHATALIANSLHTQNSATVTYDQGLAGSEFSVGPGGSWGIKKGTYRFSN